MNVIYPQANEKNASESLIRRAHAYMQQKAYKDAINTLSIVVKGMNTKDPQPNEILALLMMADSQKFSGLHLDAYKNYVIASELEPGRLESLEPLIFHCLSKVSKPQQSTAFEKHLIGFFNSTQYDNYDVDRLVTNMLIERFNLNNDSAELDFSSLISDQFLIEAITHLVLASSRVELFLSQLRKEVFHLALESDFAEILQPIVIAFAEHAELVEYAFQISADEKVILMGIETLLSNIQTEEDTREHLGLLCLYAMYESPISLKLITDQELGTWPQELQSLFKRIYYDRQEERRLATNIPEVGAITNEVSVAVMGQYQQNPYPRWQTVFCAPKKVAYLDFYRGLRSTVSNEKKFSKHLNCLVAGCGTGKQPIGLAINCKDMSIKALDLSLPSISYAQRKAKELGLMNQIDFLQGDILDLDRWQEKFDVIQCSGVLHHMADPQLGLKLLSKRLRKDGILRLGLYSKIARDCTGINEARTDSENSSLEDIRDLRHRLLSDPSSGNPTSLPETVRDFFITSECRDLLFHVQEHQYDLIEIKALLERNHLRFLGFNHLSDAISSEFSTAFDSDVLNLDAWHEFELNNPYIFKGMYQFHCQKMA
jgi:SAM-dependent methyltransferase